MNSNFECQRDERLLLIDTSESASLDSALQGSRSSASFQNILSVFQPLPRRRLEGITREEVTNTLGIAIAVNVGAAFFTPRS
jgi:hypothetical protein